MPWTLLAGAASGIGNYFANKTANDRAQMMNDKMFRDWMNLTIPDPAEQKVALERFVSTGELVPVMQKAIAQDPSAFEKIVTNSDQVAAQNRALSELQNIGYEGGLRLQDKAGLQDARIDSIAREKAGRQGIVDSMARKGLTGSGYDVAAQLSGQQGVADREADASLKVAAGAQDRALQAIMGAGKMATDFRGQDFAEKSQKAAAADKIAAFNIANLRDVNQANTSAQNYGQEFNLKNKQRIADQNVGLANAEQQYNKNLIQQNYENEMHRLAGATGQADKIAAGERLGGKQLGNTISNIGTAGVKTIAGENFWDDEDEDDEDEK